MSQDKPLSADEQSYQLSPGLRSFVSIVIFVHLFGICLALLACNSVRVGAYSALLAGTNYVMSPYLSTLFLDSRHDDFIISEEEFDADHRIDAELKFSDGHTETKQLGKDLPLPEQRQRYVCLANKIAQGSFDNSSNADGLAGLIAKGLLDSTGAESLVLRCRRYRPQTVPDVKSGDVRFHDPRDEHFLIDVYIADASQKLNEDGELVFNIVPRERSKSDVAKPIPETTGAAPPVSPPADDQPDPLGLRPPPSFPKPLKNR